MQIHRGEIWWADLGIPQGSGPGYRRPVLVLQSDSFNESRIATAVCVALSTNTRLAEAPGNVLLSKDESELSKDSVINISQIVTIDKDCLMRENMSCPTSTMKEVEEGIRLN
jgi:mRNA interferase MazF